MKKIIFIFSLIMACGCDDSEKNNNNNTNNSNSNNVNNSNNSNNINNVSDACYFLGMDETRCSANSDCEFRQANFNVIFEGKTIGDFHKILVMGMNDAGNYAVGVCHKKRREDGAEKKEYCGYISQYSYLNLEFGINDPIPAGWELCSESVPAYEPFVCGNGIIELGEQCDSEQLGSMSECSQHGDTMGTGDWVSGTVKCDENCRWDYSNCTSGQ